MQEIATVLKGAASLHGHVAGHLLLRSLRVRELQPPLQLAPQNPVFSSQILVPQQQLMVHRPSDVGQDTCPLHKSPLCARRSARAPLIAPKTLVDDTRRGYVGMG